MRQQIPRDIGGTVRAVFPGVPTDVTVTVKNGSGGDLPGTSIVDAVGTPSTLSLTINPSDTAGADPEAGDLEIVASSPAARLPIIGEPIEFVNASTLERQTNAIRSFRKTGTVGLSPLLVVGLTDPLSIPLASGDLGQGIEATITLNATQCPTITQNLRAVFTGTVNGFTVRREVIFDVGLRESCNPATVADLREKWPDHWRSEVEEWTGLRGLPALNTGYDRVETRIFATGRNPNRIRDARPLAPLVVNRAFREMAVFGLVPSAWTDKIPEYIALLDKDFDSGLVDVLSGVQWYDDQDQGTSGLLERTVTRGSVTLSR